MRTGFVVAATITDYNWGSPSVDEDWYALRQDKEMRQKLQVATMWRVERTNGCGELFVRTYFGVGCCDALTEGKVENREQLRQEFWEELQGDPTALRWQWFGVYEAQLAVVIGMCRTFPRWF